MYSRKTQREKWYHKNLQFFLALILTSLALLSSQKSYAQDFPKEKRIYLLDVTKSMSGFNNNDNIFEKVRKQLIEAIQEVDEKNTEIVVIPYTNRPYPSITGNKKEIIEQLKGVQTKDKNENTNIVDAWKAGVAALNPDKVNYMFLLTDGQNNIGSAYSFYKTLEDWGNVSKNKWYFAFYVMLTQNAMDQDIRKIADATPQMWNISGLNINVSFMLTLPTMRVNVYDQKTKGISFKCNHPQQLEKLKGFTLTMEKNPYYSLKSWKLNKKKNIYEVQFAESVDHNKIPLHVPVTLSIKYDTKATPLLFFTPEKFTVILDNLGKRTMTFYQDINLSSFKKNKK